MSGESHPSNILVMRAIQRLTAPGHRRRYSRKQHGWRGRMPLPHLMDSRLFVPHFWQIQAFFFFRFPPCPVRGVFHLFHRLSGPSSYTEGDSGFPQSRAAPKRRRSVLSTQLDGTPSLTSPTLPKDSFFWTPVRGLSHGGAESMAVSLVLP